MKKNFYSLATLAIIWALLATPLRAQVTVGDVKNPESFSILELISGGNRGLRLPELTTAQRDALNLGSLSGDDAAKAEGLTIFNTTTLCVETWNGSVWISACMPCDGITFPTVGSAYNFCSSPTPTIADLTAKVGGSVSWYNAIAYCNKLSIAEGKEPCYSVTVSGQEVDWANLTFEQIPTSTNTNWDAATCNFDVKGYRLPTEWEWEYAARGGTQTNDYTYAGSNDLCAVGWYIDNAYYFNTTCSENALVIGTQLVGKKAPNELDLYDISGNVLEWCWNWSNDNSGAPFATPGGTVPSSGDSHRAVSGGGWGYEVSYCTVSARSYSDPYTREITFGFRVVCKAN